MKLYRNVVILVVILGLLIGAMFFFKNRPTGTTEEGIPSDESFNISDIADEQLVKITADNNGTHYVFEKKETVTKDSQNNETKTTEWILAEPAGFEGDSSAISDIASSLRNMYADKVIEEDASDLSIYGLDKPSLITAVLKDGSEKTFELGNDTPTRDYSYVKIKGENKVYTVDSYTIGKLRIKDDKVRNKQLFDFKTDDILNITMEKKGQPFFSVQKESDKIWKMTAPISANADLGSVNTIAEALPGLTVSQFVENNPADLAKYGLQVPKYAFELKTSTQVKKIYLGNEDPKNNAIYARMEGTTGVFTVSSSSLTFLDKPLTEIVDSLLCLVDIKDVNKLTIDIDGRTDVMDIQIDGDGDDAKEVFKINGKDVSNVKNEQGDVYFKKLYQTIIGIFVSGIDADGKPEGKADVTVTYYIKTAPGTIKLEFIPKDTLNYYAVKNGEYTGLTVAKREMNKYRDAYKTMMEMANK